MQKQVSPKVVSLTFSLLVLMFLAAFYVVAWQEPITLPPGGNVDTPINTGSVSQVKTGGLGVGSMTIDGGAAMLKMPSPGPVANHGTLYVNDTDGNIYFIDESGGEFDLTAVGSGIPPGMIAMFDTSCPSGWTRFAALDGIFARGATTYGGTGGNDSVTLSVSQLPSHQHTVTGRDTSMGVHSHSVQPNNELATKPYQARTATKYYITTSQTGDGSAINIMPRYLDVVWCKKD